MQRRTFVQTGVTAGAMAVGTQTLAALSPPTRGWQSAGPILLDANENPLGLPAPARQAVMDALADAHRYERSTRAALVEALAAKHGVTPEYIALGNGSTEVLQMAVQVMGSRGARFLTAEPSYEDVPRYAKPWELDHRRIPLRSDWAHDVHRMGAVAANTSQPVVVYICNPNNPTGTVTPSDDLDAWIGSAPAHVHFLVDEAYFEYAEGAPRYWSALRWVSTHPNVIVTRTFSKIYAMAGMRLGYGVAHPETAARLRGLAGHDNANSLALAAALVNLQDPEIARRGIEVNAQSKRTLYTALDELGLRYLPSRTNFVMHEITGDIRVYIERMRDAGFHVGRPFPPMLGYNRVSLGHPRDMETFGDTLRRFRQRGWI
jgi:histidinol-phosphate aminotransferase